ncbi:MAG: S4 domain-containing protein, partial [Clostridium sp.]|nr:S4 domain-containing protein [Clostridium sp.]
MKNQYDFKIEEENINERLDVFLSKNIEDKSRSYIKNLIEDGSVKVNGILKKSNYKLKKDDSVVAEIPDDRQLKVEKENIKLDIMYEDNDLIVVNKPQ